MHTTLTQPPLTPTRSNKRQADHQHPSDLITANQCTLPHTPHSQPHHGFLTPDRPTAVECNHTSPLPHNQDLQKPKSKRAKQTAPAELVSIRAGKLVLKQKPRNFLDEISVLLALTELKIFCQQQQESIAQLRDDHLGIIAKLTQESDKTISELAKIIKQRVMGAETSQQRPDVLPLETIENAISRVAHRVNYGLHPSDVASSSTSSANSDEIPVGLQLWRWEVTDPSLLQVERLAEILTRREERLIARASAVDLFQALSVAERESLLSGKKKPASKSGKAKTSDGIERSDDPRMEGQEGHGEAVVGNGKAGKANGTNGQVDVAANILVEIGEDDDKEQRGAEKREKGPSAGPDSKTSEKDCEKDTAVKIAKKKSEELSPEEQAEKDRKEAEREEKRKQKEAKEARKFRQLEQIKKSASMMSGFFGKAASPSKETQAPAAHSTPTTVIVSDYEKSFVPIVYKNVAPINRLALNVSLASIEQALDSTDRPDKNELLSSIVPTTRKRRRNPSGLRTRLSVRDTMRMVAESDLMTTAAQAEASRALESLKDCRSRKAVPVKLLQFATDLRPGYFGTWTRPSRLISGRRPLIQDPVALDYNYDSDAEWVDGGDGEGDKGEEVGDDNDDLEDAMSGSEGESEMADWLVDDLEEEEEAADLEDDFSDVIEIDPLRNPLSPILGRDLAHGKSVTKKRTTDVASTGTPQFKPAGPSAAAALPSKRTLPLPGLNKKKKKKVRTAKKFTTRLTPLTIGPHWALSLGETAHSAFAEYQIEFLNDAYVGLNPFTFISSDLSALSSSGDTARSAAVGLATASTTAAPQPQVSPSRATKFGPSKAPAASTSSSPQKTLHAFLGGNGAAGAVDESSASPLQPSRVSSGTASGSTLAATPSTTSGSTSSKPMAIVPSEHLSVVLQTIEGSSDTKAFLLEKLAAQYKDNRSVTRGSLSNTITLAAEKAGTAKRGGTWRIKDEWRARAELQ